LADTIPILSRGCSIFLRTAVTLVIEANGNRISLQLHRAESTRALSRLLIMEIDGAVVQLLHESEDSAARTGGNEQPTGQAMRLNQLPGIWTGLPDRRWIGGDHIPIRCSSESRDTGNYARTPDAAGIEVKGILKWGPNDRGCFW
jgi:hypothetical protein